MVFLEQYLREVCQDAVSSGRNIERRDYDMTGMQLTKAENEEMKKVLIDFVYRVSAPNEEKRPEEIYILPAIIKTLVSGTGWIR